MTKASPAASLRPFLPADAPMLAAIFRASVEDLTADDYNEDQRQAWASVAEDEGAFGRRLAGLLTLVVTIDGAPAAFASLKGNEKIDMVYVYPTVARQGLGTMLVEALEKLSRGRGATRLTVDASDTSRVFFEARGFKPQHRNVVPLNGEWLANTTLEKHFGPDAKRNAAP